MRFVILYCLYCLLIGLATAILIPERVLAQREESDSKRFYIGTYTGGSSQGIYLSSFDQASRKFLPTTLVAEIANPSFLAIHPQRPVLYAVSEVAEGERQLIAYAIQSSGKLEELSHTSTSGSGPCYVSTTPDGSVVLVANYGSGSVASFATTADGALAGQASTHQHQGSSLHPRQKGPHAHCILSAPGGKFVTAVDLGLDKVIVYELAADGSLQPHGETKFAAGSGPRHMAFHPNGKHAFVIHELTCQLSLCSWDAEQGKLLELQTVSTLPADYKSGYSTAEVLVHPNGRFVYGSNRGHDTIAVFEFDSGQLKPVGHTSTAGRTPRNFRIDPSGQYLLVENQNSDQIVLFSIDQQTGQLSPTGETLQVGSPVCIKFYP